MDVRSAQAWLSDAAELVLVGLLTGLPLGALLLGASALVALLTPALRRVGLAVLGFIFEPFRELDRFLAGAQTALASCAGAAVEQLFPGRDRRLIQAIGSLVYLGLFLAVALADAVLWGATIAAILGLPWEGGGIFGSLGFDSLGLVAVVGTATAAFLVFFDLAGVTAFSPVWDGLPAKARRVLLVGNLALVAALLWAAFWVLRWRLPSGPADPAAELPVEDWVVRRYAMPLLNLTVLVTTALTLPPAFHGLGLGVAAMLGLSGLGFRLVLVVIRVAFNLIECLFQLFDALLEALATPGRCFWNWICGFGWARDLGLRPMGDPNPAAPAAPDGSPPQPGPAAPAAPDEVWRDPLGVGAAVRPDGTGHDSAFGPDETGDRGRNL
jgi:hypothetical protein